MCSIRRHVVTCRLGRRAERAGERASVAMEQNRRTWILLGKCARKGRAQDLGRPRVGKPFHGRWGLCELRDLPSMLEGTYTRSDVGAWGSATARVKVYEVFALSGGSGKNDSVRISRVELAPRMQSALKGR